MSNNKGFVYVVNGILIKKSVKASSFQINKLN